MIYLDHNATTAIRPQALAAMMPFLERQTGNPASVHGFGRAARQGLDQARQRIGSYFGVHDSLVCFTGGATEANNLAISGIAAMRDRPGHVVTSAIEHPSVLEAVENLGSHGHEVTVLEVDASGRVSVEHLERHLRADTFLVSIMMANNETGVVQPFAEIGRLCRERGILFHLDAVQGVGRISWFGERGGRMPADMVSVSAHKLGGPQGVGALILERSLPLKPLLLGGGQERGRRAGTQNLPGIVGFGTAIQWLSEHQEEELGAMARLRDHLEERLLDGVPGLVVFGREVLRIPNTSMVGIEGIHGETLVMNLDLAGFAISSGSACTSGRGTGSHVLAAMGVPEGLALAAVRISVGWNTRMLELERFIQQFIHILARLRGGTGTRSS
ncbi:MAG: cysteine desulfurase [Magnetococcales bacterium]|nr:cysteine desulfurase [Magnetococcales bacterium]